MIRNSIIVLIIALSVMGSVIAYQLKHSEAYDLLEEHGGQP